MASSSSSSRSDPSSSSSRSYKYDVFLNFRGEDTRNRFVDHLHKALIEKSIITFKDDKELLPGESISPSLLTAIEESHFAVIVFSENYADSSWCLEELAYIMKCEVERGLIVMPIFYDVEPTEVRKQTRKFGEAFARHDKEKAAVKVESWRKALADASNNVGFHSKNRPETEFIQEIVDKILDRLPLNPYSYVDEGLVGMPSRIKDLKLRLKIGSDGVRMVGIWGVGGGGKTTLATSVFMEISHQFEGGCIVENVREKSSKLEKLQKMILSAVIKTEVKVDGVAEGKREIKRMLCRRKVLVLLDDVDQLGQLEALAGSHNWFGNGSRIIITTRDEHLLKTHKVDDIYQVKLLSDDEAMSLFNKHAFNEKEPIQDYKKLSLRVVCYAAGLPLALKVLGSFLYDKNDKEWRSALDRLKDIPEKEIVEKLKISYDGLKEEEQELFLDIACYFRGWNNNAREILEACGFHLDVGIKVLRQKALINIDANGRFEMHDLVQEMGHFIVRREHPNNPEYHSRLWKREEIMNLSLGDATKKNDTIEATGCYFTYHHGSRFNINNFSNMKKLRWLYVEYVGIVKYAKERPNFLSNELRYIYWRGYPGISILDSFQPTKLVVLKLEGSLQKVLWNDDKDLPCLKVLTLKEMKNLVITPDFDRLPCLQKLTITHCDELEEIHPSLGNHKSVEYVRIVMCRKLRKFPTIVHMEKLQTLEIEYCRKIHELSLNNYERRFQYQFLRSLQKLDLSRCGLEGGKIISGIVELSNLEELNISDNTLITRLDSGLSQLTRLKILNLKGCYNLEGLPELSQLTRLKILNLEGCHNLEGLPELPSSVAILKAPLSDESVTDSLTNCKSLCYASLEVIPSKLNEADRVIKSILQGKASGTLQLLQLYGAFKIPKELKPCLREGSRCRLELPENWRNEFSGFLMCAVGYSGFYYDRNVCISTVEQPVKKSGFRIIDEVDWKESDDDDDDDYDRNACISTVEQPVKESGSMESQLEVDWKESDDDDDVYGERRTWVGYISFSRLRDTTTSTWWDDQIHNHLWFSYEVPTRVDDIMMSSISGFGVALVPKRSGSESKSEKSGLDRWFNKYFDDYASRWSNIYYDLTLTGGLMICFFLDD